MTDDRAAIDHIEQVIRFAEQHGIARRDFLRLLGAGAGAAAAAPLLAALGPAEPALAAPSAPGPLDLAEAAAGQGTRILIYSSGQDISNLDPHTGNDYSIASSQKSVYDTLNRYQGNPPKLENVLAQEISASSDAKEWTIRLVRNARFHDGSPVTAEAVAYSFSRLLRKKKGPAFLFIQYMDENSAVTLDDYTVKVTLKYPYAPFEQVLPWLFVVNPAVVKANEKDGDEGEAWLKDHSAGSGAYRIKRWEVGNLYEFEAVPDYWFGWKSQNRLDGYIWRIIREGSSRRIALEKGDVHFADFLSADDILQLKRNPNLVVNEEAGFRAFAIKLNNQKGPTADINVRKAISYAFDYDAILEAQVGRSILMEGPVPPRLEPWHRKGLPVYRLDMDKAKEHLAKSAHPNGGFELEYVWVTGLDIEEKIGLILIDQLSQLNIKVKMTAMLWPDMVARARTLETAPDMMAVYSGSLFADPDNFLWQAYHSTQAGFWAAASWYKNPEFDKLLEDARATTDQNKRRELYDAAQLKLVEDAVEVWGMSEFDQSAWSKCVGDYRYTPIMGIYFQPMSLNC